MSRQLQIRAMSTVTTKERPAWLARFCGAADSLREERYRVGLLGAQVEMMLVGTPWPFAHEHWLAVRGDQVVGRIGASVSATEPTRGAIGMYEVTTTDDDSDEVARALLEVAEDWLRGQGAEQVFGPMVYNTWFPYRFRVDNSDEMLLPWEPVNPPAYPRQWEAAGYKQRYMYHSDELLRLADIRRGTKKHHDEALEAGFTLRAIPTDPKHLAGLLPTLHRISNRAFVQNPLFEPLGFNEFSMLYAASASKRKSLGSYLANAATGEDIGYIVNFVDNGGRFVIKTWAVDPDWQGKGLSHLFLHAAVGAAMDAGHRSGVAALLHDGNRSEHGVSMTGVGWHHEYALFHKKIS